MAAKLVTHLDRVKAAIKAFEAAQARYSKYGAQDTEPDAVFQWTLAKVVSGKPYIMPTLPRDWQLFTSTMKCGTAARALTAACTAAVTAIQNAPVKELSDLKAYLRDYCWRTHVD